jgi:hypothetical protein
MMKPDSIYEEAQRPYSTYNVQTHFEVLAHTASKLER